MTEITHDIIKRVWHNKANSFVIKIAGVYALWKVFHYWVTKPDSIIHQSWLQLIEAMGTFYASATSTVLNIFNQNTISSGIEVIYQVSKKHIRVEDHCLAIPAMVVFTFSIILFGGQWKHKLWFIPLGWLGIFTINLVRLMFVCYAFENFSQQFYEINHSFVYVAITYGLIFAMIMWWMKKFDD